jgi:hypothetical protein
MQEKLQVWHLKRDCVACFHLCAIFGWAQKILTERQNIKLENKI